MKKGLKLSLASILAISAITPVAAFAAESVVVDGFYTSAGYYTNAEFARLAPAAKKAIFADSKAAVVINGLAYNLKNDVAMKTDTQIDAITTTVEQYEAEQGVSFESGVGFDDAVEPEVTVDSVKAIDETTVEVKFPSDSDIEESDLTGKTITLMSGDQSLTAEFDAFNAADKTATFSLSEGSKLVDATTYTVTSQGFTFTTDTFQARVKAPVATTFEAETTAVTAGDSGSVYITAEDQYGDAIDVPANVKLSGTLNELPLTPGELSYNSANNSLEINRQLNVGDEIVINIGESVLEFIVVEAEASVLQSFKIIAPDTVKSGVTANLEVLARDQFNNRVTPENGQVRWTVNGDIVVADGNATYAFNEGAPGDYKVKAFYMVNGKVNATATITVTVEGADLAALIGEANAMEDKGFTTASWNAFTDALDEAKVVAADSQATQAQIDTAVTNLTAAQNGLVDAKPAITKATIVVGGETVEFTSVAGATAALDLTGLDSASTATVATVTASEKSTLTLSYKGATKDVELAKGENSLTAQDLIPGLNPDTPVTVGFLQSLNADGELNITTSLKDYTTEDGQIVSGTLTIGFDSADASAIKAFIKKFDAQAAYDDTETLTNMGPRVTGTQAEKDTINFLEERLNSFGYSVEVQEFDLPATLNGTLTVDGAEVASNVSGGVPANGTVTAPLFDGGFGKASDFTADAAGKVALISRGEGVTFVDKVANAEAAGAVGVIIYNNIVSESPLKFNTTDATIPAFGITQAKGQELLAETGDVTLDVAVAETLTSANVIATKLPDNNATDAEIVYLSAHIDSVPGAPGANDNGAGTAAALEFARVMKDVPLDKELRIAFVGAEEIGLVGSKIYADRLTEEEISRSIANFNTDMVATSWEPATAIFLNTTDGQSNLVTDTAKKVAGIISTPSEVILRQGGSSDHVSFHEKGIPSANFIRLNPDDFNLEPDYHQPGDTMDNVSLERLEEIIELVGGSVYDVVRKR